MGNITKVIKVDKEEFYNMDRLYFCMLRTTPAIVLTHDCMLQLVQNFYAKFLVTHDLGLFVHLAEPQIYLFG